MLLCGCAGVLVSPSSVIVSGCPFAESVVQGEGEGLKLTVIVTETVPTVSIGPATVMVTSMRFVVVSCSREFDASSPTTLKQTHAHGIVMACLRLLVTLLLCTEASARWWPFASPAKIETPKPVVHRLADVKDQVFLSAAFGRKTEALCREALDEDRSSCRSLVSERLFCALFKRHADKYQGFEGVEEEEARCKEVDIMETAVEAAKDARLQRDADRS